MSGKSLGVLGGMGPKATAVFFDRIVEHTEAGKDQDHIDMVIVNHATLPDRTTVIAKQRGEVFLEAIRKDIRLLELAGVGNIAIPCNTSHYFFEQLQGMTKINIINMAKETASEIRRVYGPGAKVGILATTGTIKSGVYQNVCEEFALTPHIPDELVQQKVMKIIYDDVKSGVNADAAAFAAIIRELVERARCACVIIACTELSCIKLRDDISKYCVDAMDVLVRRSIELSGKKVKKTDGKEGCR
ncbi:MAG TPA: amino acid racemase [Bacilli bacterium]